MKKMRQFLHLVFLSTLICFALTLALPSAKASQPNVRGTEQDEAYLSDPLRTLMAGVVYLPRQVMNGTFYGAGEAASFLSDPEFIEKVEDILYLYKHELAWFPIVNLTSGFRPEYGVGWYHNNQQDHRGLVKATMSDADFWSLSLKSTYYRYYGEMLFESTFFANLEKQDDMRFSGIGSNPKDDIRNRFLSGDDYGVFTEDRRQVGWKASFYPEKKWGLTYLGYFERRAVKTKGHQNQDLEDVLNLSSVPGVFESSPVNYFYNEVSAHVDTRNNKLLISPGWRGEVYTGIAAAIGGSDADLFKTGFDVAVFIPTIKEDRVIVPRVVFDLVEDIGSDPIPFNYFAHHPTFRGLSSREYFYNDSASVVPSIEYLWPLNHMFSGHLFFDYLAVGPTVGEIDWGDGAWASGLGFDFHYFERVLANIEIAGGSEGLQISFKFGVPLRFNKREG